MKAEADPMFELPESTAAREHQRCPICHGSDILIVHHNTAMIIIFNLNACELKHEESSLIYSAANVTTWDFGHTACM
jgi:hypothetical protein